ncbi:MAG: hypothetical protein R2747_15335 [Pyrinomonadaceae bacterium]
MPFNPNRLPPTVHDVYKKGPSLWVLTVKTAIEVGITDVNKLTDIAFHQHNPDLEGRALEVGETDLIAQWKYFRRLIQGMAKAYSVPHEDRLLENVSLDFGHQDFHYPVELLPKK